MVDETIELATRMGTPRAIAMFLGFDGLLKFHTGPWCEAERLLRESLSRCRSLGLAFGVSSCLRRLGRLLTAQGRLEEARLSLEESLAVCDSAMLKAHAVIRSHAALALNRLQAGDHAGALAALGRGDEVAMDHGHCASCNAVLLPAAVWVHVECGQLEAAADALASLERVAERYDTVAWRGFARQGRARLSQARGQLDAARAGWQDALDGFCALGNRYEALQCRRGLAAVLRDADPARAAELSAEASAGLAALAADKSP